MSLGIPISQANRTQGHLYHHAFPPPILTLQGMLSFADVMQQAMPYAKIIFPNAPFGPMTMNFGLEVPTWHDIPSTGWDTREAPPGGWPGILESRDLLIDLIEKEFANGWAPSERTLLAGFSMGGAMALYVGYSCRQTIGGIVTFSGYSPFSDEAEAQAFIESSHNCKAPAWYAHGSDDPIVSVDLAYKTKDCMLRAGSPVAFRLYPRMVHTVTKQVLADAIAFMRSVLEARPAGPGEDTAAAPAAAPKAASSAPASAARSSATAAAAAAAAAAALIKAHPAGSAQDKAQGTAQAKAQAQDKAQGKAQAAAPSPASASLSCSVAAMTENAQD